jgi:hypothetical protein
VGEQKPKSESCAGRLGREDAHKIDRLAAEFRLHSGRQADHLGVDFDLLQRESAWREWSRRTGREPVDLFVHLGEVHRRHPGASSRQLASLGCFAAKTTLRLNGMRDA